MLSLIFFACLCAISCHNADQPTQIIWQNEQAVGISISAKKLQQFTPQNIADKLQVKLLNNVSTIIGQYIADGDQVIFMPVIPFTRGLTYQVIYMNEVVDTIKIPLPDNANVTSVVQIYPTSDTVPENLLKLYLQFSSPMQQGEALKHIALLKENNDTVPNVFLNLQPELWNAEGTVLTIWVDPGRVKRDLIPNQQMGNPLIKDHLYKIVVSTAWKDVRGLPLQQAFTKTFAVGHRDSLSPSPQNWKMKLPPSFTTKTLTLHFAEPLDYYLLQETIRIADKNGNIIDGTMRITDKERALHFTPTKTWQPGKYSVQVLTYLEDLAGNNLNRPFDRDLLIKRTTPDKDVVERQFVIEAKQP